MKYSVLFLLIFSICSACGSDDEGEQPQNPPVADFEPDFDNLFWSQEFDNALDTDVWTHETGANGWGNNEWQNYVPDAENSYTEDGKLIIKAIYNNGGLALGNFTSARMITKDKFEFKYGKIEARMKLPEGQGIWPAFWMLGANFSEAGWPDCGELDIMEYLGHDTDKAYGTVHGRGYSGADGVGNSLNLGGGQTFNEDFHTFTVEWKRNNIKWFIDGQKFHEVSPSTVNGSWPFNTDFFLLLNLAVGGDWPGYPDSSTSFPQQLEVDYIRVYR